MKTERISRKRIQELISLQDRYTEVVSIYIPSHPLSTSSGLNQDRIRLKNARQSIESQFIRAGVDEAHLKKFLEHFERLFEDIEFWRHQDKGLGIFMTPDELYSFSLPIETEELALVSSTFNLLPLLHIVTMFNPIIVLSLNLQKPKLFHVSVQNHFEIQVGNMPGEITDALRIGGYEQQQQYHSINDGSDAKYHGHGAEKDNKKDDVIKYFRLIDQALLSSDITNDNNQIIIAGEATHVALFKQVSSIENFASYTINGNYEKNETELIEIAQEHLRQAVKKTIEKFEQSFFKESVHKKHSSNSPAELEEIAHHGKIKTLALGLLTSTRDSVRNTRESIHKFTDQSGKNNLGEFNKLAQTVFMKGGAILAVYPHTAKGRKIHALLW